MELHECWRFHLKKERAVTQRCPVLTDDYVLLVFNYGQGYYKGDLIAIHAQTGEEIWRFSRDHYLNEPRISQDGSILITCLNGAVYKLDLDGRIQWEVQLTDCNIWSGQVWKDIFIYPEVHGRSKYTRALKIMDGSLSWEYFSGGHTNHICCTSDGKTIFSSSLTSTQFDKRGYHLQCVDGNSGAKQWRIEHSNHLQKPIVFKSYVLVASLDRVMLFSLTNGDLLSAIELDKDVTFFAKPIETAEGIILISENGYCLCLSISEKKSWFFGKRKALLQPKWHCDLHEDIRAQATVSEDKIYIIDESGHLNSISIQTGETLSKFKIPGFKTGHGMALANDTIYLSISRECRAYKIV